MTTLPLPNLDDRRWADLVDEARALIPFHAPGWTDHNAHDPGITLLELFAWIAEMDLYGVNQVTDAHRRKFLALAGITPTPPQPATTILGLGLTAGVDATTLPAGLEFTGHDPFRVPVRFRARHGLTVQPGRLAAVLTAAGPEQLPRELTTAWRRGDPIQPLGPDPTPGAALYLGFDLPGPWPVGTALSLGFAVGDDRSGDAERAALAAEAAAHAAGCARPWEIIGCAPPAEPPAPARPAHHDAVLRWELRTGPDGWLPLAPDGAPADVVDDARALSLDGRVVLRIPAPAPALPLGQRPGALRWLRVRLARGGYDAPPVLRGLTDNAVRVEQAVPAAVRLRLAVNAQVGGAPPGPGELTGLDLALNPAGEVHRVGFGPVTGGRPAVRFLALDRPGRWLSIEAAAVVRGTGGPGQRVTIPGGPLVAASLRLHSREGPGWRGWAPRPDFDTSTRAAAHVVADPTAGELLFGDGEHGRVLPAGSTLLVTADLTRAAGGNLVTGAIDALADTPHNRAAVPDRDLLAQQLVGIANVLPAGGGAGAETVPAALARARDERERANRAVTLDDYVALARQTPGVRLARVEARANLHPGFGCQRAPGVVTVLVLPHLPAARPVPGPGLRRAVAAYLHRRRVIGTRIEVTGPQYLRVTVRAAVTAGPGTRAGELAGVIRDVLDRFLHPLLGGPDGTGWPFGRDVYRSEVLTVIDEVPGVAHIDSLDLVAADGPASCANVCLGPLGLVEAGPHEIVVR